MKFGWTDDEDEFLSDCLAMVEQGECDLSAEGLKSLLDIIARYRKLPELGEQSEAP